MKNHPLDMGTKREYLHHNNFIHPIPLGQIEARLTRVPLSIRSRDPGQAGKGMPPKWEPVPVPVPAGSSDKICRTVTYVERYRGNQQTVLSVVFADFSRNASQEHYGFFTAPVVLIVLGIEVLIYAARPDVKIKYDVISIFLCIIIMLTAGASGAVAAVAQAFTPENVTKRVTTEEQYKKTVQKALSNIPNAHDFVHDYSIDVSSESWFMDMPVGTMHATVYLTMNYGAQTTAEEFVRDCMKVMDAVNATDIPVEYYRFDVDQSNLTDGEVWSVWLDEWEMHGNLQNIAAHVDTVYYVDGDAYTSLDDVPKKDGDELLNRYMAAFGTNPLTDYQNEYGTVEFGDELEEYMQNRVENEAGQDLTDTDNAGKTAASEETPAAQDDVTMEATEPAAGAAEAASENAN